MITRRFTIGLALLATLTAACATDPAGPRNDTDDVVSGPLLAAGDATTAAVIEAQLGCLYEYGLLPDAQSSLGKFDKIKRMWARGDQGGALAATAKLVEFIDLKYSQYTGSLDVPSKCGTLPVSSDPTAPSYYYNWTLAELKDGLLGLNDQVTEPGVVTNLWSYVGLEGNVCALPANNAPSFCQTPEPQGGFVYFPANIFANLSYVSVELQVKTPLQNLFDEYPNQIEITVVQVDGTVGGNFSDDVQYPVKPIVVVCFNDESLYYPAAGIQGRLQVLTKHNGVAKFLPKAPYDQDIQDYALALCDPAPAVSPLAMFGRSVINFLLPAPLQAAPAMFFSYSFGGAGGSAEEFSPFTIGDPGMSFGGAGGSAEEFAPVMLPSGPMAVNGVDNVSDPVRWYGQIGDNNVTTGLPGFTITTQWRLKTPTDGVYPTGAVCTPDDSNATTCFPGQPIAGAVARFTLMNPSSTGDFAGEGSSASLCGTPFTDINGDKYVDVTTDSDGEAYLPCLNFGSTLGYKNLKMSLGLSLALDLEACFYSDYPYQVPGPGGTLYAPGQCIPDPVVNFLIQTIPGQPAKLSVTPASASGAAGAAFDFDVQVQDQSGTDLTTDPNDPLTPRQHLTVTVTAAGYILGGPSCTGAPLVCTATTNDAGVATFTDLTVGGLIGDATLSFTSGTLTAGTATVTINAAGPANSLELTVAPVADQLDKEFATPPVVMVTDKWGNPVSGAPVSVSVFPAWATAGDGKLDCVGGGTCTTGTTGSDGKYTFANLTITDLSPISAQTLRFTSGSTTCLGTTDAFCSASVTPLPGDATTLTIVGTGSWTGVTPGGTQTATVKLADASGNGIGGKSIGWSTSTTFGGSVSPASSTTSSTAGTEGQAQATWTLGDDGSATLTATYGTLKADFTATTANLTVTPLECALGSNTKKLDFGGYNPATGKYTAWFSFSPELQGRIGALTLQMSVTGQSSGVSNFPVEVWVTRGYNGTALAYGNTAVTTLGSGSLMLPGDNGSPTAAKFPLTATAATLTANNNNTVYVQMTVKTNDAGRTPQVWATNSNRSISTYCGNSTGYPAGTTNPTLVASRNQIKQIANMFER